LLAAAGGKPFKIVPIMTNSPDPLDHEIVARALTRFAGNPKTLIVLSTDLSHYPTAETAVKVDKAMLAAVASLSARAVEEENRRILKQRHPGLSVTMCGLDAVVCLERAAKRLGITKAKVVSYTHSAMAGGDNQRVVGYGAVIFTGSGRKPSRAEEKGPLKLEFSEQSRKELLAMARKAAEAAVKGEWVSYDPSDNPELQVRAGCFVTLRNKGRLRGCIGRFRSNTPLWRTVREMAVASATMAPRFKADPIRPSELPELEVEISILSPIPMKNVVCSPTTSPPLIARTPISSPLGQIPSLPNTIFFSPITL
jgi:hypothetical protein